MPIRQKMRHTFSVGGDNLYKKKQINNFVLKNSNEINIRAEVPIGLKKSEFTFEFKVKKLYFFL